MTITGPTTGIANTAYTFSATVSPPTATTPISYTWSPAPDSGQGTPNASYTWTTEGVKTITVTAANAGGAVSDTHLITITGLTVRVITYEYDPLGRLVEADYNTGERFEYAYGKVGNRLRYTQTITGTSVITYVYDAANRLTSVNGVPYTWDNTGNLINDGTRVYTYSQSNRLVAISGPGLSWSAAYNGDGARLWQTVNGSVTTYTLDLAAPLVTVLAQQDANGTKHYVYARGTRPLAQYNGEAWAYLLPDGLGSVRHETDAAGNLLATRSFDPFGVPLEGDGGTPYGYTSEEYDGSTGLVFLRARYMQPTLGIFLSRDLWKGDALRPLSMNGCIYVEGNPINFTDPSGRIPRPEFPKYEYSCNCGWIDWTHANPGVARNIINRINAVQRMPDERDWHGGKALVGPIDQHETLPKLKWEGGVQGYIRVSRYLGENSRLLYEVSLGVYIEIQNLFERYQGGDSPLPIRGPLDKAVSASSFSEEDLMSDLIGFYLALGIDKDKIREECGVVGLDEPDYQQKQAKIYYRTIRPSPYANPYKKVDTWFTPYLYCDLEDCKDQPQRIPGIFFKYSPIPHSRNGLWYWSSASAYLGDIRGEYDVEELNR